MIAATSGLTPGGNHTAESWWAGHVSVRAAFAGRLGRTVPRRCDAEAGSEPAIPIAAALVRPRVMGIAATRSCGSGRPDESFVANPPARSASTRTHSHLCRAGIKLCRLRF